MFVFFLSLTSSSMDIILVPSTLNLTSRLFRLTTGASSQPELLQTNTEWSYSIPPLHRDEFYYRGTLADQTPPSFTALSSFGPLCFVQQLPWRPHSNPAFEMLFDVRDRESVLNLSLSVGTSGHADDVFPSIEIGGTGAISIFHTLLPAINLFFTITATNQNGLQSFATCSLPRDHFYDRSPPLGRITPIRSVSSHPSMMRALIVLFDEFGFADVQEIAIGRLRGKSGSDVLAWTPFNATLIFTRPVHDGNIMDLYSFGRVS